MIKVAEATIILTEGRVRIVKDTNGKQRRIVLYHTRRYVYARLIWDKHNPNNKATKNDIVHHRDEDTLNDEPENLNKITRAQHTIIHKLAIGRRWDVKKAQELYDGGKTWSEVADLIGGDRSTIAKFFQAREGYSKSCTHGKWTPEEVISLRRSGWSWGKIGKHFGVSRTAFAPYFKRHGYAKESYKKGEKKNE